MIPESGAIALDEGLQLFFQKVGTGPQVALIPNGLYFLDDFRPLTDSRTFIFYDVRNRGLSDPVTDSAKLVRGIQQDVDDLDAVRRHFGIEKVDLIGHSYIGLMIALYAIHHPGHVNRLVQIGPTQPDAGAEYPPELTGADSKLSDVFARIAQLQKERPEDPVEACNKFWSVLREIFVADPADAEKIHWGRCELANERNFMKYWSTCLVPSIQQIHLTARDLAHVKTPVLIIHGRKDRNTPYGGAIDWQRLWPNARLLTVDNAAHAPWIEQPHQVLPAIADFLGGADVA